MSFRFTWLEAQGSPSHTNMKAPRISVVTGGVRKMEWVRRMEILWLNSERPTATWLF